MKKEFDVLVAGYGGAGAAAAIAAHDAGAKVVIVESEAHGGGNTCLSMGGFLCPSSVEDAISYLSALYDFSNSEKDDKIIRTFCEESVKNVEWVKSLKEGTQVHTYGHAGFPQVPGSQCIDKYLVKGKRKGVTSFARNLWDVLTYAVEEKRRILVLTKTPAKHLLTRGDGEVIGVLVKHKGEEVSLQANRAVILTTGGYEYDCKTLQNHVKGYPIYAAGNPGNKGDGIRMSQKVGAALWHMNAVSCGLGIKVPDFKAAFLMVISTPRYIIVDTNGKRFMNEHAMEAHSGLLAVDHYDTQTLKYPRIPCYAIFDEAARLRGPISRMAGFGAAGQKYRWSKDNTAEIEKGWICKGRSIDELAKKLKISKQNLNATVTRWNRDVRKGRDTEFNRQISSPKEDRPAYKDFETAIISAPIEKPPFYGLELYPCLANTQGGPRRNEAAQVVDPFGHPIPRLYSAGELGSMWGSIYQGAGNIAECLVFGRIAGKNAANETPWT